MLLLPLICKSTEVGTKLSASYSIGNITSRGILTILVEFVENI
jgi:hypothetical protein